MQKNREFNAVRADAVTSCKTVSEVKTLIEATGFTTSLSADTAEKSSGDLKNILESERAKMTEATKQVIVEQGFGGVAEFESWFEVA
jgi:predicted TIM-barrel enzyme